MKEAPRAVLLGAGQVGEVILRESLAAGFKTTVVDANKGRLENLWLKYPGTEIAVTDLKDPKNIGPLTKSAELIYSALPGPMGYVVLKEIVKNMQEGGKVSDVSFAPEDTSELNEIAKQRGITVAEQVGMAPGLPEIVLAHHKREMVVRKLMNHSAGLSIPKADGPFGHDPYYHTGDIIELYREADVIHNGQWEKRPALTADYYTTLPEFFGEKRELVGFYSPGLKFSKGVTEGLLESADITLRDVDHFNLMRQLRDLGFLDTKPVELTARFDGQKLKVEIPAVEFLKAFVVANWAPPKPGVRNGTFSLIEAEGMMPDGTTKTVRHILFREDVAPTNSLSILTGSVTFAVGKLLWNGELNLPAGIHQPDAVGLAGGFPKIVDHLKTQGILYVKQENK